MSSPGSPKEPADDGAEKGGPGPQGEAAAAPAAGGAGEGAAQEPQKAAAAADEGQWLDEEEELDEDGWLDEDGVGLDEALLEDIDMDMGMVESDEEDGGEWVSDDEDEMELEEWADFLEGDMDALSQSSEEGEMGQATASHLAAATAGRYLEDCCTVYNIPTAHYHFQSADALALAPGFGGGGAGAPLLLATFDKQGVAAWVVPPAGAARAAGPARAQQALRLGGFQHPSDIFTMTCSHDGRYIVTGGEAGILTWYTVNPKAPPRPTHPNRRGISATGVTYFYTPLEPPGIELARAASASHEVVEVSAAATALAEEIAASRAAGVEVLEGFGGTAAEVQAALQQLPAGPLSERHAAVLAALPPAMQQAFLELDQHIEHAKQQAQPQMHRWQQQGQEERQQEGEEQRHSFFQALVNQGLPHLQGQLDEGPEEGQQVNLVQMLRQAARNASLLFAAQQQQPQQQQQQQQQGQGQGQQEAGPSGAGPSGSSAIPSRDAGAAGASGAVPSSASCKAPAEAQQQGASTSRGVGQSRLQQLLQRQPSDFGGQAAAVMMSCMIGLGQPEGQGANAAQQQGPFNGEAMANGARFGLVGGKQRLAVAEQSGFVYVFEVPPSGTPRGKLPQQLMCRGLGAPSPHWRMLEVTVLNGAEVPAGVEVRQMAATSCTAAIGPFGVSVNMAVPSPDGTWLAVVGDSQAVFLVNQSEGFCWDSLELDVTVRRAQLQHEDMSIGAQYCSWHSTAPLLAVSSDGLFATFVFNAATKEQVFRVEGHARPCLGVMFAPFDPSLLVYNEETKHVFVREWGGSGEGPTERSAAEDFAEHPLAGMQLLRLPLVQQETGPGSVFAFNSRRRRITGMAASPHGDLLVSTKQGAVFRFFAALPWTPARHQLWPLRFRQAARELLLCAHRRPHGNGACVGGAGGQEGSRTGLWALPVPVVLHVIEALAGRRAEWLAEEQEL